MKRFFCRFKVYTNRFPTPYPIKAMKGNGECNMMRTGILGALDEEISFLLKRMTVRKIVKIGGKKFYLGYLNKAPIVLGKSGVGKVNAALATQLLIGRFHVRRVIFTGVAGGLKPGTIKILDTVISTKTQQYDVDFRPLFPLGVIPYMKTSIFPADPMLVVLARKSAGRLAKGRTFIGKIISGDRFYLSKKAILGGVAVDAESAAVGQAAYLNKVPYAVIRTISDQNNPEQFKRFLKPAALRSQYIVSGMLKWLAARK